VKWHLSIDDWQTSEDWLNASDCDLVILISELLAITPILFYHFNLSVIGYGNGM
jgi:hypothetical protein